LSVHLGTDPTSADPTATWPQTGAGQKGGASMLAKILIGLGVTLAVPAVTIILVVTCGLPEVAALDAVGALGVEAGRDLSSLRESTHITAQHSDFLGMPIGEC